MWNFYSILARVGCLGTVELALALLLAPALLQPQTGPELLQETASVMQTGAQPLLDREGACLAWRTADNVFVTDAMARQGAAIAGSPLKAIVSSNGARFAILEKTDEKQEATLRLRWFDRNGRPRGSHVRDWHGDQPLPQFCFNEAATRLLLADAGVARLTILNLEGEVVREVDLFGAPRYFNERPLFIAAGGEEFFVLSQALPSAGQLPVNPVLLRLSAQGEEIWRRELTQHTGGGIAVSPEGRWILAGSYAVASPQSSVRSELQLFDGSGNEHFAREGLFRHGVFTQNGDRVLIVDRRQVRLLRVPGGEVVWENSLSSRAEMFAAAAADANGENIFALIATSAFKDSRFVYENARLVRFDSGGKPQQAATISSDLIEPVLAVALDGGRLALAAEGRLRCYAIRHAKSE